MGEFEKIIGSLKKVSRQNEQILTAQVETYYKIYLNLQKKLVWVLIILFNYDIIQISKKGADFV